MHTQPSAVEVDGQEGRRDSEVVYERVDLQEEWYFLLRSNELQHYNNNWHNLSSLISPKYKIERPFSGSLSLMVTRKQSNNDQQSTSHRSVYNGIKLFAIQHYHNRSSVFRLKTAHRHVPVVANSSGSVIQLLRQRTTSYPEKEVHHKEDIERQVNLLRNGSFPHNALFDWPSEIKTIS